MPDNTPWWLGTGLNPTNPQFAAFAATSGPAYERVSAIPSWLPHSNTNELVDQYQRTGEMFSTSDYDKASESQQSRVLTTALNAGNAAADEYANRARQSGGSGLGAGLIKAQASVGARKVAGDMQLEEKKFDASQREKAAGHAASIAQTLGQLRQSYLQTIVDYATKEDATSADFRSRMAAIDSTRTNTGERSSDPNQFDPGYVTNSGPIRSASINGRTLPNTAFGSYPSNWLAGYGG